MITIKECYETAKQIDSKLLCSDERFNRCIQISHHDGSYMFFDGAFIEPLPDDYFILFTEHHGYKVYHEEDCNFVSEFYRI